MTTHVFVTSERIYFACFVSSSIPHHKVEPKILGEDYAESGDRHRSNEAFLVAWSFIGIEEDWSNCLSDRVSNVGHGCGNSAFAIERASLARQIALT